MMLIDAETRRKIVELYQTNLSMTQDKVSRLLGLPVTLVRDVLDCKA